MNPLRIMLIEDSPAYREVIAFGLSDEPDLEIVSQFSTADAAYRSLRGCSPDALPDLILLDLNLPGSSGLDAIRPLKELAPETEIIVLTESNKEADILSAISSGATGYLLKDSSLDQITEGIRSAKTGGAPIDPSMARHLLAKLKSSPLQPDSETVLTERELEILKLLADGLLQKQIAEKLAISPKTVDYHTGRIYKKLGAHNAPAAVARAYRSGLLTGDS